MRKGTGKRMDEPARSEIEALIGKNTLEIWESLAESIDRLYEMDKYWNKGFGDWVYEYKYRRGGKTLCTFYAKQDVANLLVILGKMEREKFEQQRGSFSECFLALYDSTKIYYDGKWLWIPIDEKLETEDILRLLKIKRRPNRKENIILGGAKADEG